MTIIDLEPITRRSGFLWKGNAVRARLLVLTLLGLFGTCATGTGQAPLPGPDDDPSRIDSTRSAQTLGPMPNVRGQRFGVVIKTQANEYWRLIAQGLRRRALADGVKLDIQAAQTEDDASRQVSIMEMMVGSYYKALLVSPQSSTNLLPAINDALAAHIPLVNIDGAVAEGIDHFVGPRNWKLGASVAEWFVAHVPAGGNVAVIQGQAGVLSTVQRTAGFRSVIERSGRLHLVSTVAGDWDRHKAFDAAALLVRTTPDLVGIYCNNDVMALGAVEAVKQAGALDRVHVFGTDGTSEVYASIRNGDITGTVSMFPLMLGATALEIAERLSSGQSVPRVIETPQALVTLDNVERVAKGDEP